MLGLRASAQAPSAANVREPRTARCARAAAARDLLSRPPALVATDSVGRALPARSELAE
jgi:hypothetical protein